MAAAGDEQTSDPLQPRISVIIPVRDAADWLERSLDALDRTQGLSDWELIVVDDGSRDGSGDLARQRGATVLRTRCAGSGPAAARNLGAAIARAPLLCFLDADVVATPFTLARFDELFQSDPGLVAAFGSYDASPFAPDFFSQYRNLLHHFVHQSSREAASTFWAGCGAIRREAFLAAGGFDVAYRGPSIEDIELGYRLVRAGARIRLARHIQVTHLKRWTLWGILKTDIRDRALPWTALIARSGRLPDDLNLRWGSRVSAVSVFLAAGLLVGGRGRAARAGALAPLTALLLANRRLYGFFWRRRGLWFVVRAIPMHWLYYAYSSMAFALGTAVELVRARRQRAS